MLIAVILFFAFFLRSDLTDMMHWSKVSEQKLEAALNNAFSADTTQSVIAMFCASTL